MPIGEILFVLALLVGMLGTSAWAKQWRLFFVFLIFFVIFGLCEWLSVAQTDMSISQHFWDLSEVNPTAAWVVIGGMGVGWLALLWHFAGKHLLKRR